MQKKYEQYLKKLDLNNQPAYDIAGGKCVLSADGKIALILNNGRYPAKDYSLNSICTEKITVLEGSIVLDVNGKLQTLSENQSYAVTPGNKYCLTGQSICQVDIDPPWDKQQNKTVPLK